MSALDPATKTWADRIRPNLKRATWALDMYQTLVPAPSRLDDLPETRATLAQWILRHGDSWYRNQPDMSNAAEMADAIDFDALARVTAVAPPYWIVQEMCALVDVANRSYEPSQDVQPLAPTGFAYFQAPLTFEDNDGSWSLAGFVWSRDVAHPIQEAEGKLFPATPVVSHGPHMGGPNKGMLNAVGIIQTLWLLASQRLTVTTTRRPDRAARRRCARLKVEDGDVQVIDLRRLAHAPGGGTGSEVDWSHRWMVDGHWRNHYYPSEDKHRQIWIAPHVKGPPDKPLVVQERVYRWKR